MAALGRGEFLFLSTAFCLPPWIRKAILYCSTHDLHLRYLSVGECGTQKTFKNHLEEIISGCSLCLAYLYHSNQKAGSQRRKRQATSMKQWSPTCLGEKQAWRFQSLRPSIARAPAFHQNRLMALCLQLSGSEP